MRNCLILFIIYLVCAVMLAHTEKEASSKNIASEDMMVDSFKKNQGIRETNSGDKPNSD